MHFLRGTFNTITVGRPASLTFNKSSYPLLVTHINCAQEEGRGEEINASWFYVTNCDCCLHIPSRLLAPLPSRRRSTEPTDQMWASQLPPLTIDAFPNCSPPPLEGIILIIMWHDDDNDFIHHHSRGTVICSPNQTIWQQSVSIRDKIILIILLTYWPRPHKWWRRKRKNRVHTRQTYRA